MRMHEMEMNRLTILKLSASAFLINICSSTCKCDLRNNWVSIENNLASYETFTDFISIDDVMKHRNFADGPRLRFGVLVVVKTLMAVFRVVTPSSLVGGHQTVCHFLRKWTVIITYRPMNFGMHGTINPDFSGANTSWDELPALLYKHRAYI
jgi:hypothetical protein